MSRKAAFRNPFIGRQIQTLHGTPKTKKAAKSDDAAPASEADGNASE